MKALDAAYRSLRGDTGSSTGEGVSVADVRPSGEVPFVTTPFSKLTLPKQCAPTACLTPRSDWPVQRELGPTASDTALLSAGQEPAGSLTFSAAEVRAFYTHYRELARRAGEVVSVLSALSADCGRFGSEDPSSFTFNEDSDPVLFGHAAVSYTHLTLPTIA